MENEEKIGFFKRIGIAMTNPKDYHKIAKESAGKSIFIYFLLSIIYTLVIMAVLFFFYNTFLTMATEYINNLPEFSISKNGFVSQMENPLEFYDSNSGALIYIDSNKTLEEIKNVNIDKIYSSNAYILLGNDAFSIKSTEDIISMTFIELFEKDEMNDSSNDYLQQSDNNEQIISGEGIIEENEFENNIADNEQLLPNISDETQIDNKYEFNKDTIKQVFEIIESSNLPIFIFGVTALFMLVIVFVAYIFNGLIYCILTLIMCSIYKKDLSFKEIYNVSMYSNITVTILSILMLFVNFAYWGIIQLIIIVFYMQIAIKNYDDNKEIKSNDYIIEDKNDKGE